MLASERTCSRVQLMTESYPDRQDYSKKHCLLCVQGAWHVCPINMGQPSQDFENLSRMPKQSGACIRVDMELLLNQHRTLSWCRTLAKNEQSRHQYIYPIRERNIRKPNKGRNRVLRPENQGTGVGYARGRY